jgi:hypothetical protein
VGVMHERGVHGEFGRVGVGRAWEKWREVTVIRRSDQL